MNQGWGVWLQNAALSEAKEAGNTTRQKRDQRFHFFNEA